jgi:hypothetical protein
MTPSGRVVHWLFLLAAMCFAFTFLVPASWPRHVILFAVGLTLLAAWIAGAFAAALWDLLQKLLHGNAGRRQLDAAYRAGHDAGATEGPSAATLARWRRQGFS